MKEPKNSQNISPNVPNVDWDPFDPKTLVDPYALHAQVRDSGPVVWLSRYGIYGVARFTNVVEILKNWEAFTSERGVGLSDYASVEPWRPKSLLLETDPPVHDRTRNIANKVVSLSSLRAVRSGWAGAADDLVQELLRRRTFDAIKDLAEVYPQRVFADTIGLRDDGRENLVPYATANFNAFGPQNELFHSTEPMRKAASAWIEESCTRPYIRPGGWGAAFFEAADRGECTEAEASRLTRSLITAGFDTTINGLGHMLNLLADEPAVWAELKANPSLAKRAVEETLRLASPVQTFFRTTTRDVAIENHPIPANSKVLLFLGAANRDPRRWEDPDRFLLRRQTSGHVVFGFGLHQCLGQMIARQEAELVLLALLARVAHLKKTAPVVRRPNNTLYALASLPLELVAD